MGIRRLLMAALTGIVAVGGLVPAHTEFDHLTAAPALKHGKDLGFAATLGGMFRHAVVMTDGGTGWGRVKADLIKVLGTCMDYGVPQAVQVTPATDRLPIVRDACLILPRALDRTEPRPPSA